jgi:hypothetical protein
MQRLSLQFYFFTLLNSTYGHSRQKNQDRGRI